MKSIKNISYGFIQCFYFDLTNRYTLLPKVHSIQKSSLTFDLELNWTNVFLIA